MPAYRFCRSDDVPLLVRAYNECYGVNFADLPQLTLEGFKAAVRRLDLWTSSCMVAQEHDTIIGVLLAAKRDDASLIHCVGIHPDHQRQGHGRHLMTSLSQKLAILGPRRMVAEVPAEWAHARAFLEACGYESEREYTDFFLHKSPAPPAAAEFVVEVTLDELVASDAFDVAARRCWGRAPRSLLNRRESVRGLAVATDERVEAYLLYHEPDRHGTREILGFDCAREDQRETLLGLLLGSYCAGVEDPVMIQRADPEEIPFALLEAIGFRAAGRTQLYASEARPA